MENFIVPICKGLENLRNGNLDPRDLFLYENVYILPLFMEDYFDYNVLLHFEVRVPPNWKGRVIIDDTLKAAIDAYYETYGVK